MKLNYFVFCDGAAMMEKNKVILMGIFDHITPTIPPSEVSPWVQARFHLAFQIEADSVLDESVAFSLISPSGKELAMIDMTTTVAGHKKSNQFVEFVNFKFEEQGDYRAKVSVGGETFETSLKVAM